MFQNGQMWPLCLMFFEKQRRPGYPGTLPQIRGNTRFILVLYDVRPTLTERSLGIFRKVTLLAVTVLNLKAARRERLLTMDINTTMLLVLFTITMYVYIQNSFFITCVIGFDFARD